MEISPFSDFYRWHNNLRSLINSESAYGREENVLWCQSSNLTECQLLGEISPLFTQKNHNHRQEKIFNRLFLFARTHSGQITLHTYTVHAYAWNASQKWASNWIICRLLYSSGVQWAFPPVASRSEPQTWWMANGELASRWRLGNVLSAFSWQQCQREHTRESES